ncbi:MAG: hypothetical protein M3Q10_08380 [Chloroflexota bacterium]|nr:hypothetical protein [Chloroflexota bacterium]
MTAIVRRLGRLEAGAPGHDLPALLRLAARAEAIDERALVAEAERVRDEVRASGLDPVAFVANEWGCSTTEARARVDAMTARWTEATR